jgi:D-glycero-D-manno-heptose 1,7-bisphosphate phosphatase
MAANRRKRRLYFGVTDFLKRTLTPAVFLDRDGVIVENRPDHVKSWAEVRFLDKTFDAMARLTETPTAVVIVSNQAVVGRGIITLEQAWDVQDQIVRAIEARGGRIDASYLCPHHPDDGCLCRKPAPGMLRQAAEELGLDLKHSWLVGDAITDMQAGQAVGARCILVRTGRGAEQEAKLHAERKDAAVSIHCTVVDDLAAAVQLIKTTSFLKLPERTT